MNFPLDPEQRIEEVDKNLQIARYELESLDQSKKRYILQIDKTAQADITDHHQIIIKQKWTKQKQEAAITIQAAFRGYYVRNVSFKKITKVKQRLKAERQKNKLKDQLESLQKSIFDIKYSHVDKENAATRIQSVWRGLNGRNEAVLIKFQVAVDKLGEEYIKSAQQIQRMWREHKTRKCFVGIVEEVHAAHKIQQEEEKKMEKMNECKTQAALKIQKNWRRRSSCRHLSIDILDAQNNCPSSPLLIGDRGRQFPKKLNLFTQTRNAKIFLPMVHSVEPAARQIRAARSPQTCATTTSFREPAVGDTVASYEVKYGRHLIVPMFRKDQRDNNQKKTVELNRSHAADPPITTINKKTY
eukprot:GHVL01011062.1.p1 GENE.GHVL01011062.1~~GHVL01011062.1.p1  ORF type:complete len:357 (-),score=73.43 GHVL01011062.1:1135-2205(-)